MPKRFKNSLIFSFFASFLGVATMYLMGFSDKIPEATWVGVSVFCVGYFLLQLVLAYKLIYRKL